MKAIERPELPSEVPEVVYQIGGALLAAAFLIFGWRMLNGTGRTVVIVAILVLVGVAIYRNS